MVRSRFATVVCIAVDDLQYRAYRKLAARSTLTIVSFIIVGNARYCGPRALQNAGLSLAGGVCVDGMVGAEVLGDSPGEE